MTELLRHRHLVGACRVAIAIVFLAAALPKIADPAAFALQVQHFRLTPPGIENLIAITLPWVELTAALAILLRLQPRAGAVVTAGLMTVFAVAVASAAARHLDIECGCFGTADGTRVGLLKLAEDLGLLALAGVASLEPRPGP